MSRDSHYASDHSGTGSLMDILTFPFRLVWGFIVFMVFAWTTSRSGRAFILAVPAMFFAVVFLALVWVVGYRGQNKAVGLTYSRSVKAVNPAEPAYNPDAALLYLKKLVDLEPEEPIWKHQLGLAFARTGDMDRAFEVMSWMAPENLTEEDPGFADSHLWLADYYRNPNNGKFDENQRQELQRIHIENAYNAKNSSLALPGSEYIPAVMAKGRLERQKAAEFQQQAEDLRKEDRIREAEEMERLAERANNEAADKFRTAADTELQVMYASDQLLASIDRIQILQEQGKDPEAVLECRKFINKYEKLAIRNPNYAPAWITLIRACILMEDYDRAKAFALRGLGLSRNAQVRKIMLQLYAGVEIARSQSYEDMDDRQQFVERLFALSSAISSNPLSPLAYQQVLYFVDGFEADSEKDIWLRDSVLGLNDSGNEPGTTSGTPGVIHLVLGLRDVVEGNVADGRRHWEIANVQFENTALALYILIRVYSQERDLSFEKKMELVEVAIKQFPQEAILYALRGKIRLDEEKFDESIADLKFAHARLSNDRSILELLIQLMELTSNEKGLEEYQEKLAKVKAEASMDEQLSSFYSTRQQQQKTTKDNDVEEQ